MNLGISGEVVLIVGMVVGLLAGVSFMSTGGGASSILWWTLGLVGCAARLAITAISEIISDLSSSGGSIEEESYQQLPERVSDAVTLIGLGFAVNSNPWLGLVAALLATLSSYMRALREAYDNRGFMNRKHRLIVVLLVSITMIIGVTQPPGQLSYPGIGLLVISCGCFVTIIFRLLNLERQISD